MITESRFYKEMLRIMNDKECSKRECAKECGVGYLTILNFFNPNKSFQPIRQITKARLHNHLGIDYDIIEEYNELVLKERGN